MQLSSIYVFRSELLWPAPRSARAAHAQGELYLTDAVRDLVGRGERVAAHVADDPEETEGVNTRVELADAAAAPATDQPAACSRGHDRRSGLDLDRAGVELARTRRFTRSRFSAVRRRSPRARSRPACRRDRRRDRPGSVRRPFCYLRLGTVLGPRTKAAFVEIKKSIIGQDSKVPHLSPTSAMRRSGRNIGAGSITANFPHRPGLPKGKTTIGSNVRVAVDTLFVAPVTIGDDAWTAAGAVITDDVPDNTLAGFPPGAGQQGRTRWKAGRLSRHCPVSRVRSTAPQLMVGRALSLTPQKRLAVVAGSSHPELATKIAGHLGRAHPRRTLDLRRRSPYFRFEDSVRGADMFIVQTAAPSIGEHLMELLIMVNAAKLTGEADHRRHPLVLLRAPGQEVPATRADHRAPRRRPARRRPASTA